MLSIFYLFLNNLTTNLIDGTIIPLSKTIKKIVKNTENNNFDLRLSKTNKLEM